MILKILGIVFIVLLVLTIGFFAGAIYYAVITEKRAKDELMKSLNSLNKIFDDGEQKLR